MVSSTEFDSKKFIRFPKCKIASMLCHQCAQIWCHEPSSLFPFYEVSFEPCQIAVHVLWKWRHLWTTPSLSKGLNRRPLISLESANLSIVFNKNANQGGDPLLAEVHLTLSHCLLSFKEDSFVFTTEQDAKRHYRTVGNIIIWRLDYICFGIQVSFVIRGAIFHKIFDPVKAKTVHLGLN